MGAARRDGDGEREDGASASVDEEALVADDEVASEVVGAISRGGAPSRWLRFKFKQVPSLFLLTPGIYKQLNSSFFEGSLIVCGRRV